MHHSSPYRVLAKTPTDFMSWLNVKSPFSQSQSPRNNLNSPQNNFIHTKTFFSSFPGPDVHIFKLSSQLAVINFILVQYAQAMGKQLDVVELITKSTFPNEG